jgi:hypothetical protein
MEIYNPGGQLSGVFGKKSEVRTVFLFYEHLLPDPEIFAGQT